MGAEELVTKAMAEDAAADAVSNVSLEPPADAIKTLYKELEADQFDYYRLNGFVGERSQWSRNFGVDGLDSDGGNLANYIVRISRDDAKDDNGVILGNNFLTALMTNNVSYSLNAGWDVSNNQVSSMVQGAMSGILGAAAQFGGVELGSAGYTTRKIYKGGTDMGLSINFRLFDSTTNFSVESDSSKASAVNPGLTVMDGVKWINSIMIPSNLAKITIEQIENFTTELVEGQETAEEKAESAKLEEADKKKILAAKDALASATGGDAIQNTLDTITGNLNTELDAAEVDLTASPPPVSILIGKWLYIDRAVVTNASFNFSTEMSSKGPLYCDVTLEVSTQENLMMIADDDNEMTDINRLKLFNVPKM